MDNAFISLESKNKEILDSIQYAKRIQLAILPSDKVIKHHFQSSFILYKPKDIVAGDFYWMEDKDDKVLFAVADCTGHGVPGAMVSVVCNNGLNMYDISNKQDPKLIAIKNIPAEDVIPLDTLLLVTAEDGMYQYSYNQNFDLEFLSKLFSIQQ